MSRHEFAHHMLIRAQAPLAPGRGSTGVRLDEFSQVGALVSPRLRGVSEWGPCRSCQISCSRIVS